MLKTIIKYVLENIDGKRFMVAVSPMTENESLIELWEKKTPQLMIIGEIP